MKKFLEKIEINVLTDILSELLVKSGMTSEHIRKKEIKVNVVSDTMRKANAWHNSGSLYINAAKFDFNSDYKKDYKRILSAYIHEYVHAMAMNNGIAQTTGFKWVSEDGVEMEIPINEGFTELIADYVFEEYLKRSGGSSLVGQKDYKRTIKGYLQERSDAFAFVSQVSQQTGIPEDVVMKSFIRAYFSQDIDSLEDIRKSFS